MIRKLEFYEKELQDQIRQYRLALQMGNIRLANIIYDSCLQPILVKYRIALFHPRNEVPPTVHVGYRGKTEIRLAAYLEGPSKLDL
jgi:hypothetical protein